MNIETMIQLNGDYVRGDVARKAAYANQASSYAAAFEAAWQRRQQQRAADTAQWQEVILPAIKEEAALRAYEAGMDRNSGAVPEAR